MNQGMTTYDMYIKHTDVNGNSHIQEHRVWDGEKFFNARAAEAKRANAAQKPNQPRRAAVLQVTREDYLAARAASKK